MLKISNKWRIPYFRLAKKPQLPGVSWSRLVGSPIQLESCALSGRGRFGSGAAGALQVGSERWEYKNEGPSPVTRGVLAFLCSFFAFYRIPVHPARDPGAVTMGARAGGLS